MLATRTLQAASGNSSYQIPRSLRFRSENGSFLSKSLVTPTDNKKWTWSGWVKRAKLSTSQVLFGAGANSNTVFAGIYFSGDNIDFFNYDNGITWRRTTSAVYRDPSAWMHVVCIFDSNNATALDQVQVWVNGVRITAFSQTVNPGGASSLLNSSSQPHTIGLVRTVAYNTYFDGYMADVYFVDGQALNASNFGQTDPVTGVWGAKRYAGTYGNNGFYLNFSDPTDTTTICADRSGNGNNWTSNNIALSGSTAISTFTSTGTTSWIAPAGVTSVQYLVVGGGGGGYWGGGGAGGFRTGTLSVTPGNSYTVTVGAGGASQGLNGSDSVFSSITSIGGGGGPNGAGNGAAGGSGGGGGSSNGLGGAGTAGQGFAGGRGYTDGATFTSGGGGGGAGGAGSNGGNGGPGGAGGPGVSSSISGSAVIYAGGGGGYGDVHGPGPNGAGGGSTPNRGGGGSSSSTAGGSGVVILSYPGSPTVPTYDSMLDAPLSSGGNELGNYCTLNPVSTSVGGYVRQANLSLSGNSLGEYPGVGGTIYVSTGKWYWEYMATAGGTLNCTFGFSPATSFGGTFQTAPGAVGYTNDSGAITVTGSTVTTGASFTSGDIIAVALDLTAGTAQFYKNNVATGALVTGLIGTYTPAKNLNYYPSNTLYLNCGQRPFNYAPPTGFLALHTGSFSLPTIRKPNQYFDIVIRTGTGASYSKTGLAFAPDFVWLKSRSNAYAQHLFDVIRGANKVIYTDLTSAEATQTQSLMSFNSDGYTLGTSSDSAINQNGSTFVDWLWKAGGSAASNTAGSITSQVSANTTSGFSVITYTGTGSNATVGHGLGVAPKMVIVKNRSNSAAWAVRHASLGPNDYLLLNLTNAVGTSATVFNGAPTSSVINIGTDIVTNSNANTYVAYCFAEIAGFSKISSYTGNGSTDGPFIYCGFRPKYFVIKRTDTAGYSWWTYDSVREPYNAIGTALALNSSAVEEANTSDIDFLSNGIKMRTSGVGRNASGGTYVFMAFAEAPFKSALAR